jgi:hypothetical protein
LQRLMPWGRRFVIQFDRNDLAAIHDVPCLLLYCQVGHFALLPVGLR